jgi:hypothetical protein
LKGNDMAFRAHHLVFAKLVAVLAIGCTQEFEATRSVSADGAKYLLSVEPEGAQGVTALRDSAQDDDQVVVVGRIGGGVKPWIEGRAAFVLVDAAVQLACEEGETCSEGCACCAEDLANATAMVKFVDTEGRVLPTDARKLLGVKDLEAVVVQGTAQRDQGGNLTVLASGIYIRR